MNGPLKDSERYEIAIQRAQEAREILISNGLPLARTNSTPELVDYFTIPSAFIKNGNTNYPKYINRAHPDKLHDQTTDVIVNIAPGQIDGNDYFLYARVRFSV